MFISWHNLFNRLQGSDGVPPPGIPLKILAAILTGFYGLGARARRGLYNQGWLKVKRLPAPVVSVGNLTVGGTGKTPLTACLARLFQGQGKKVAILSRGYRGAAKQVTCISDGCQIYARPPAVGEEAYWLARALPGVAVYTAPARYDAGLAAWQDFRPDLFLLDDGFQHFQLHRDLDVALLDAEAPFGNGHLLPRGPLREPVAALAAAQVLILTRFRPEMHQDRLDFLRQKFPGITVLTASVSPTKVFVFPKDQELPLTAIKNRKLLAFAGLARPRVFYDTLKDLGVALVGCRDFPDHYAFKNEDLEILVKEAQNLGAAGLVTTAKDWARLGEKWPYSFPLHVLDVEARLEQSEEKEILEALGEVSGPLPRLEAWATGLQAQPDSIPLPPEVRQRFQGLQVRGKLAVPPDTVQRILVRVPNWVGDAMMALPVLAGVHMLFPQSQITVLAAPRVAPLFAGLPGVSQVTVYPPGREKWRTLWHLRQGQASHRKQETENRKPSFDLGLALPNSFEAALGLWLAGAGTRVGYNTDGRGPLLNVAVSGARSLAGLHTVYYFLGVLQGLGGISSFTPPRLYLADGEITAAAALLENTKGEGPWVGLSPGAAYGPAKRWPPERFAAVGAKLVKKYEARVVLLGGAEDRDAGAQVKAMLPEALDLTGRTSLRQALAVLTRLKVLITNDSGLMHAAAALGTPLAALFGSTDPVATGPFTHQATVLRHPLPCSPCLERTCDQEYQCLLAISVEEVLDAAQAWLQDSR